MRAPHLEAVRVPFSNNIGLLSGRVSSLFLTLRMALLRRGLCPIPGMGEGGGKADLLQWLGFNLLQAWLGFTLFLLFSLRALFLCFLAF